MKLDTEFVREQFPAFSAKNTCNWSFFENAGGSYIPSSVLDRLNDFFVYHKVQPYGSYELSEKAGIAMDLSYSSISSLINARENEITIGPSTTLNLYVLAQSLRKSLKSGDEIIVTNQDHEANIGCWRRLEDCGIVIKEWKMNDSAELDLNDLENLASNKTRLVCVTLCSNIIGTHNDIGGISNIAEKVGALLVADGVSYAPHMIPDVEQLGVDFYVFSTYKTFGTHQGVLWCSDRGIKHTEAQGHFFNDHKSRYRLNPAGPQHAQIGALSGICEYYSKIFRHHYGPDKSSIHVQAKKIFTLINKHETFLANMLLNYLGQRDDVCIIGKSYAEEGKRASTVAFYSRHLPSDYIAKELAKNKIGIGSGNFYALRCVKALGVMQSSGILRVSMVHYNTTQEVTKLIDSLDEILNANKKKI